MWHWVSLFFIVQLEEGLENFIKFKLDPSANLHLKEGALPWFFACQKHQKRVFTVTGNGKLHVKRYSWFKYTA